jgi:hypothetical protein
MATSAAARLLEPRQRRGAVWVGLGNAGAAVNRIWGFEVEEAHRDVACDGIDGRAEELDSGGLDRRSMAPARTSRSSMEPMQSLGRQRGHRFIVGGGCLWCGVLGGGGKQPDGTVEVNVGLSSSGTVAWRQLQEARLGPARLTAVGLQLGAAAWVCAMAATWVL